MLLFDEIGRADDIGRQTPLAERPRAQTGRLFEFERFGITRRLFGRFAPVERVIDRVRARDFERRPLFDVAAGQRQHGVFDRAGQRSAAVRPARGQRLEIDRRVVAGKVAPAADARGETAVPERIRDHAGAVFEIDRVAVAAEPDFHGIGAPDRRFAAPKDNVPARLQRHVGQRKKALRLFGIGELVFAERNGRVGRVVQFDIIGRFAVRRRLARVDGGNLGDDQLFAVRQSGGIDRGKRVGVVLFARRGAGKEKPAVGRPPAGKVGAQRIDLAAVQLPPAAVEQNQRGLLAGQRKVRVEFSPVLVCPRFAGQQDDEKALVVDRDGGELPFFGFVLVVGQKETFERNGLFGRIVKLHPADKVAVFGKEGLRLGGAVFVEQNLRFFRFGFHNGNGRLRAGNARRRRVKDARRAAFIQTEALVFLQPRDVQNAHEPGLVVEQPQRFAVAADRKREMEHAVFAVDPARLVRVKQQARARFDRHGREDELLRLRRVVGQRPAGEVDRLRRRVVKLDPVGKRAVFVREHARVAGHRLADTDRFGRDGHAGGQREKQHRR